jgi:S-DNA-T family DNA segregation ATPase FtsK/SpoIIIE
VASRLDWSFGPGHTPLGGAFNAAGAAAGATFVARGLDAVYGWDLSPAWAVTAGVLAAATAAGTALLSGDHQHTARPVACYRAVCWLGAGIWSTVQLATPEWTVGSLAAGLMWLAGGATAAGVVGAALARREKRKRLLAADQPPTVPAPPLPAPLHPRDELAMEWTRRLALVCRLDIKIVNIEHWDTGLGYTLDCELPATGATVRDVKNHEASLASAANLPTTGKVEILGTTGGRLSFHLKVTTSSAFERPNDYPDRYRPCSINDPLPVGTADDATVATVDIRQDNLVVVGQVGSGKSTMLNGILAGLTQRDDVYICGVDLSGNGRILRPWVRAWFEGRVSRPAIDWPAITVDKAELMLLALIQTMEGRLADYARLMMDQNSDKILPTPDLPQIVLVIDETNALPDPLVDLVVDLANRGRGAAIRVVFCALEATAAGIPRTLLKQARERIGLRFSDEAEIQQLFDSTWSSGRFDMSTMKHRGMALVSSNAAPPVQVYGYWLDPARIDDIAVATSRWRPALDAASVARADTVSVRRRVDGEWTTTTHTGVWSGRWDGVLEAMFPTSGTTAAQARPAPTRAPGGHGDSGGAGVSVDELEASTAHLQALLRQAEAEPAPAPAPAGDPAFAAIVAGYDDEAAPRQFVRDLVRSKGPIGATALVEYLNSQGFGTVRPTVQVWLKKDCESGLMRREAAGYVWVEPAS